MTLNIWDVPVRITDPGVFNQFPVENLIEYLIAQGWELSIEAENIHVYKKQSEDGENHTVVVPINTEDYPYIMARTFETLAEDVENRSVLLILYEVLHGTAISQSIKQLRPSRSQPPVQPGEPLGTMGSTGCTTRLPRLELDIEDDETY